MANDYERDRIESYNIVNGLGENRRGERSFGQAKRRTPPLTMKAALRAKGVPQKAIENRKHSFKRRKD